MSPCTTQKREEQFVIDQLSSKLNQFRILFIHDVTKLLIILITGDFTFLLLPFEIKPNLATFKLPTSNLL
jgi:hypothetical protein